MANKSGEDSLARRRDEQEKLDSVEADKQVHSPASRALVLYNKEVGEDVVRKLKAVDRRYRSVSLPV